MVPDWEYGWIILIFIWFEEHLNCFLELHSHIFVLWLFSKIFVISEFSFVGSKWKPRYHGKSLFFSFFFLNTIKFTFAFVFVYFYWQNLYFPCLIAFLWFPKFRPGPLCVQIPLQSLKYLIHFFLRSLSFVVKHKQELWFLLRTWDNIPPHIYLP